MSVDIVTAVASTISKYSEHSWLEYGRPLFMGGYIGMLIVFLRYDISGNGWQLRPYMTPKYIAMLATIAVAYMLWDSRWWLSIVCQLGVYTIGMIVAAIFTNLLFLHDPKSPKEIA